MSAERLPELVSRREIEPSFSADALVVLGRGVGMHPNSGNYAPTGLLEEGRGKYKSHTGVITYEIDPERRYTDAVIGGANSNVRATYEIIQALHQKGQGLPYVIFAAGRPKYLEDSPQGTSEGSVLRDKLVRLLARDKIILPDYELQDGNKSTIDDIRESLKSCAEKGYRNVGIITIEPHVFRSWLMAQKVMLENPEITKELESVFFIDSWKALSGVDPHYERIFDHLKTTLAYRRTQRLERGGRRALRNGITSTLQLPKQP